MTIIIIDVIGCCPKGKLDRLLRRENDMLSNFIAPWLAKRDMHYGWVIIAVTFVTMLATAGAMGLPGALIGPLSQEFGWDTGEISSALALRLALFGLIGPFAAAFIERYGVRNVI